MKKGMVNVLILALVLINVILSAVLVFTFVPAISKTSKLVDKICTIVDLDVGSDEDSGEVSIEDLTNISVDFGGDKPTETTVSLALDSDGKTHVARLSVTLSLDSNSKDYETKKKTIESNMSLISSTILDVASSYTFSTAIKGDMEKEVLKRLQDLFDTDCIYSVSFNQFVKQ